MAPIDTRPLFTSEYEDSSAFVPPPDACYIFGVSAEKRSEFATDLIARSSNTKFVEIRESDRFTFETDVVEHERVLVRRTAMLDSFINSLEGESIYLDITGLGHNVWAPLVRRILEVGRPLRVVYLEPKSYSLHPTPVGGEIYDLSERIEGIEPIPLFATLEDANENRACFVPLLGFEGARLSYRIEEVQPNVSKIYPVIGAPGFMPQYPFDALLGNAGALDRFKAARRLQYARSNCPFSLFYLLQDIAVRHPEDLIKVGLIGTKPHALGAILFALHDPRRVEIVYDHAKRKPGRTVGIAKCLVYNISEFLPVPREGV